MKFNRLLIGRLCLAVLVAFFVFSFTGCPEPEKKVTLETQFEENVESQDLVTLRTSVEGLPQVHSMSIDFRFISSADIYSGIVRVKLLQLEVIKILFQSNSKIYLLLGNILV